jgi:hypothetical protein
VSKDSTKLLTEKLALSHELSSLKPETEHLRSQLALQKNLLSEKLSLERQVNSLSVELETEKRATQRAATKGGKADEQQSKLEEKIEGLKKELSKEKRDRERAEKEARKGNEGWENQKSILEAKLEATKGKFKSMKDQLKETQAELQQAQAAVRVATTAVSKTAWEPNDMKDAPAKSRKRTAAQMTMDDVGTPDVGVANKKIRGVRKGKAISAPGDKSVFSMTPFLNKTTILPLDTPLQEADEDAINEEEDEISAIMESDQHVSSPTVPTLKPTKVASKEKSISAKALGASKTAKLNTAAAKSRPTKIAVEPQEHSEVNDENSASTTGSAPTEDQLKPSKAASKAALKSAPKAILKASSTFTEAAAEPKKRRKLLGGGPGKTLFDDEDGEAPKPSSKSSFGKAFPGLGRGGILGARTGLKGGLGGGASGFGAFSPLKKDKKVTAAL